MAVNGRVRFALLSALAWLLAAGCGGGGGAAGIDASGTWVGTLSIGGTARTFAFQLHQRADAGVMGYVLGGTSRRTVTAGSVSGATLALTLEFADPGATRTFEVTGLVLGATYSGIADDGTGPQAILWARTPQVLHERRFLFALDTGGDPGSLVDVSVVEDGGGTLVCGGFVGRSDCALLACGGGVSSFSEAAGVVSLGIESSGGCAAGAGVVATLDPATKFYAGTYTSCSGATGPVLGVRGGRTRSDHVASQLATLATIADDLEALATFTAPYGPVSDAYLDDGEVLADLLASLNAEVAAHDSIQVVFDRFRDANTVEDPDTFPMLDEPLGIRFHDLRIGVPAGGGPLAIYRDTGMETLLDDELRVFREEGGSWVVYGNQSGPMDLPFAYAVGADSLHVPTPGGTVYVSVGPWGAHFSPLTGHAAGNAKSDMAGFLTASDADLTELVGDGDGDCEPGETCGFFGGLTGDLIRNRVPLYTAPLDAVVDSVEYERDPEGTYFDDPPFWRVRLALPNGLRLDLVHVGKIAPSLRDAILAATGSDTDTFAGPPGTELLTSGTTIPVALGDALCYPQVFATPVPGFPGYFGGGGSYDRPWAQMESFVGSSGGDVCVFAHLPDALQASLQSVVDADMANPSSQRYRLTAAHRFEWAAEGLLCNAYSTLPDDFSSLHAKLGGWFERSSPDTTPDELFAIVPISKAAASYDAALYSSPAVNHLVMRRRVGGPFSWTVPGLGVVMPFYPSGEVLEETASTLLLRWRLDGVPGDVFQRVAFLLDMEGLKVKWGNYATTQVGAILPTLLPGEACNDVDVLCYDHERIDGL